MSSKELSTSTSPTLLERVRALDADAWDTLTVLYGPVVYRWCRQNGLQDQDAADISQDVFQAVARGIQSFRRDEPGSSFRGWLWTITRNKLLDAYRRQGSRPGAVGGTDAYDRLQSIPDSFPENESDERNGELTSRLAHRAFEFLQSEFEPNTWQAFLRVTVGERSAGQVASDLGMTIGAVYTAKSRVLKRLREELDGLL